MRGKGLRVHECMSARVCECTECMRTGCVRDKERREGILLEQLGFLEIVSVEGL